MVHTKSINITSIRKQLCKKRTNIKDKKIQVQTAKNVYM